MYITAMQSHTGLSFYVLYFYTPFKEIGIVKKNVTPTELERIEGIRYMLST